MLRETHRLAQENNKMLRAMRRNAMIRSMVKLIILAAFALASFYVYTEYVAPLLSSMLEAYQQVQGTSAEARAQLAQFQEFFDRFSPGQ